MPTFSERSTGPCPACSGVANTEFMILASGDFRFVDCPHCGHNEEQEVIPSCDDESNSHFAHADAREAVP